MKNFTLLISFFFALNSAYSQGSVYCTPTYGNPCFNPWTTNDMIDNFWTTGGLFDISNLLSGCGTSANNNYSDFTSQFLITQPGAVIGINVQGAVNGSAGTCIGGSSGCFPQGFAIWIDWNQDGDFTDPGEKIFESPTPGHQVFSGSFTVPPNILCDNYRLRVRAVYATGGANIDPCGPASYGETEDYTVTINNCGSQERTICEGETVTIDYSSSLPPTTVTAVISPTNNALIALPTIDFNPLDTTIYVVTFTSPDSTWQDTAKIYVNEPLDPATFAGLDDSVCDGGIINLQATPANTNTSFQWFVGYPGVTTGASFFPTSNTLATNMLSSNPGTVWAIFVESDTLNICPSVRDTAVIIFSEEFHTVLQADPTCNGFADGQITVNSFGTLGAVEYSIDNGGTWSASNSFTGLTAGIYDVISRDTIGCTFSSIITLVDPDMITIATVSDTTVCENGTATLSATSTNGSAFNWNFTASLSSNQSILPITDSTITVYATNLQGCSSDTITIQVSMYNPISVSITQNDSICPGDPTTMEITATGGLNGFDYVWSANGSATNYGTSIITLNPTIQTQYCATATDACESTQKTLCTNIIMRDVPTTSFTTTVIEKCVPAIVEIEVTTPDYLYQTAVLGTGNKQYSVANSNTIPSIVTHTYNTVGDFDLYLKVISPYGCINDTTAYNIATSYPVPEPDFYINPEPATVFQPLFDVVNLTRGVDLNYTWLMPGGEPYTSVETNAQVKYPDGVPGKYPIELIALSDEGCTDTITRYAEVINDIVIYSANSFTPDGDSHNDFWRVHIAGINIYDFHLQVFNRWGEVIFESFDPEATWDGTFGNGDELSPGTYVWYIQAKDIVSSEVYDFRGTVNLFR